MTRHDYHSALTSPLPGLAPLDRWERQGIGRVFVHDIMRGLPDQYDAADVLYADLPWGHGFASFYERAGHNDPPVRYEEWLYQLNRTIVASHRPAVLIHGRNAMRYLGGWASIGTKLNGAPAIATIYGRPGPLMGDSTQGIVEQLAERFECIGDFCCGYGRALRQFKEAGRTFVGSDINPECIGYVATHAEGW